MNTMRLINHSAEMMGRHKVRTGFMMIGSFIGVAALTLVVSVGIAAERKLVKLAHQMFGESSLMIIDGGGHMMGGPRNPGTRLKIDDLEAIGKQVPEIESWDAQQGLTTSVRRGDSTDIAQVLGESERSEHVWGRPAVQGAYFDDSAVKSSERVALIGQTVVNQLFGNEDPMGQEIQIGSVPFRVIGILETWGTDPHGMDRDNEIVVPISTLMRRLTNVDTITGAKLLMAPSAQEVQVVKAINTILRERHGLAANQPNDFSILTASQVQEVMTSIKKILTLYLPLVAAISLLAGGIVSSTLMVASVSERAAEIGLRRAVGARTEDIRLQFLVETTATTLAGGVAGILFGYVLAHMGAAHMHLGSVAPWGAALLGIVSSTVVGLAAGLLPAQRAARMSPVDALR
ncbi:MAG TPA: ABC transporter permease [Terracidiphilus sp.]|jgi:putative ABC transport system permease protein